MNEKRIKVVKSPAGSITITDIEGEYSCGFVTPSGDGEGFIEQMKDLKDGDIIEIIFKRRKLERR